MGVLIESECPLSMNRRSAGGSPACLEGAANLAGEPPALLSLPGSWSQYAFTESWRLSMNRPLVGQTFLSAGSDDFPVARGNTGLESPVNRQAGKPALHRGSWSQGAVKPWRLSMNLSMNLAAEGRHSGRPSSATGKPPLRGSWSASRSERKTGWQRLGDGCWGEVAQRASARCISGQRIV